MTIAPAPSFPSYLDGDAAECPSQLTQAIPDIRRTRRNDAYHCWQCTGIEPSSSLNNMNNSSGECCKEVETTDSFVGSYKLCTELSTWISKFNITQSAADALLSTLRKCGHRDLPKTCRTLQRSLRNVEITEKSSMQYVYLGLREELARILESFAKPVTDSVDTLDLALNVDGLPLFKSSKKSVWPVLCCIINILPHKVFPVALTYGNSKPLDLEFLKDTVHDLGFILRQGLVYKGKAYSVSLRCIVCDAPARAMVKCVKLYSGYAGCDKCSLKGRYLGRMTYPDVKNLPLRTDEDFRSQTDTEHHMGYSPFCDLPINMIDTFPIDYMHSVCLGVTKRLLLTWMRGPKEVRLSRLQIDQISNRLLNLQKFVPSIFARKPRSLVEADRWKATEFRQFLLYTGKISLKGILRPELYDHFLVLSVAICILVSANLTQKLCDYANRLLQYFVDRSRHLYGDHFLVYNIHSLLHLSTDAYNFRGLKLLGFQI